MEHNINEQKQKEENTISIELMPLALSIFGEDVFLSAPLSMLLIYGG